MKLYRPVGQNEYELIKQSGFNKFPPRLAHQPIFYPVLNQEYARQIARDWNVEDEFSGYIGYVLKFEINDEFIGQYEVHTVGDDLHQEYWIPAEELDDFNANMIKGRFGRTISVLDKFVSDRLLKPELKGTFFLSKVQLKGSCFHEFKPGKWKDESWSEESIYLRDDHIFMFALIFAKTLKKYDPYFMQEVDAGQTKNLIHVLTKCCESLSSGKNIITAYQDIGVYDIISSKKFDKLRLMDSKNIVESYNDIRVYGMYEPSEFEKQLLEIDPEKLLRTTEYFVQWLQNTYAEHGCFSLLGI